MTALFTRGNVPERLDLEPRFHAITSTFWEWIFTEVLHTPHGVLRESHWDAAPVAFLAALGGVDYRWRTEDGMSSLRLRTGNGAHEQTWIASTASDKPPFSLLTRCWFDLCLDVGIINKDEWSRVCPQLDRFKIWERPEYGDCW